MAGWTFWHNKGYVDGWLPWLVTTRQVLTVEEIIWVGRNFNSFFIATLPAVLLRFPESFGPKNEWPVEARDVVEKTERGESGISAFGFPFAYHRAWVSFQPRDGRVADQPRKKITFNLSFEAIQRINESAQRQNLSRSKWLEKTLESELDKIGRRDRER